MPGAKSLRRSWWAAPARIRAAQNRVSVISLHRFDVLIQVVDAQLYFGGVSLAHTPEEFAPTRHLLRAICRQAYVTHYRASNAIIGIIV